MNWEQGRKVNKGQYEIVRELASGNFGVTYQAIDLVAKSYVAIKTINAQQFNSGHFEELQSKLASEGLTLAQCKHPQVVAIKKFFDEKVQIPDRDQTGSTKEITVKGMVMEYIDGPRLIDRLLSKDAFTEDDAIEMMQKVGVAVTHVHDQGFLHRDLHPGNILLRSNGDPVLIDFGTVREFTADGLGIPMTHFMSEYSPPEQVLNNGDFQPSLDIYSLAATLYACVTRRTPRSPQNRAIEDLTAKQVNPQISDRLNQAIMAGMALNAKDRPSTVAAWLAMLPSKKQRQFFGFEVAIIGWKSSLFGKNLIIIKQSQLAEYWTEDLGYDIDLKMVKIPAGCFVMGQSNADKIKLIKEVGEENYQDWFANELPQHPVNLPSFWIGKYPVTQGQYQAVMGKNPAHFPGDLLPVENVSWNDAQEFCRQLSAQSGKNYRLPSEAEWEYACRAGTATSFHFGETITTDVANFDGNYCYGSAAKGRYLQQTSPVGVYGVSNGFGLYDMHGNVWEWCEDGWHESYEGAPSDGSAWINSENDYHLLRGGCWSNYPWNCRSAFRYGRSADCGNSYCGFRVVFSQDSSHSAL